MPQTHMRVKHKQDTQTYPCRANAKSMPNNIIHRSTIHISSASHTPRNMHPYTCNFKNMNTTTPLPGVLTMTNKTTHAPRKSSHASPHHMNWSSNQVRKADSSKHHSNFPSGDDLSQARSVIVVNFHRYSLHPSSISHSLISHSKEMYTTLVFVSYSKQQNCCCGAA